MAPFLPTFADPKPTKQLGFMAKFWVKRSQDEIKERVFKALSENVNYEKEGILGIPASYLDERVFNQDASFLKDAPFLYALTQNPNHIGCHTLGKSEPFFAGTQAIERELIDICAVDILKGNPGEQDGYVAAGGTEANIQAIWVYRNYFMREHGAKREEIAILCSQDSHYSMDKAGNLLVLDLFKFEVDDDTRLASTEMVAAAIDRARAAGKKYFITIANMMTTMFGSVDDVEAILTALKTSNSKFRLHVDGAYGGFYYPFTDEGSKLTFQNSDISSFTLDAHKMAQSPYGTGIFLIRKGLIQYANTQEASYVEGEDFTLSGSRSGANAIAVWMILSQNGPYGWDEKIFILQKRAEWLSKQLTSLGVEFYRHAGSNIVTIRTPYVHPSVASHYGLVPDNHHAPRWYKIVIMEHVSIEKLSLFIEDMKSKIPMA